MLISKLAEAVSKYKEKFGKEPKYKVQNESVKQMVIKKDDIYKVSLSNGETIYPAGKHPFMINDKEVILNDCEVGTVLFDNISIVSKEFLKHDFVFDFELDTEDRTYMLAGVKHHNTKVFNSIRSLMLDKKVGNYKIPEDIMIMAAMNPKDAGAIELPEHFADVVDVIDSEADFYGVLNYIETKKSLTTINEKLGIDITKISVEILKQIAERFQSSEDTDAEDIEDDNTKKFFWTDGFNVFYISAREFDSAVSGCVEDSYNILKIKKRFNKDNKYDENDITEFTNLIEKTMISKWKKVLGFVAENKADIEPNDFEKIMIGVEDIISSNMYLINDAFSTVKSEAIQSFQSILEEVNYNVDTLLAYDGIGTILEKTIETADLNTFVEDVAEIISRVAITSDLYKSFDDIISIWKLLTTVDWSLFNAEITATVSEMFLLRGWQPLLSFVVNEYKKTKDDSILTRLEEYSENDNLQKFPGALEIISERKITNVNNMFVEAIS